MKSPEQFGELPEEPKEQPAEDRKEEAAGKPPAQESHYNEAEWNKLKQGGAAFAINKGKEIGVPQEELDRLAEDVIARETEKQNFAFVYRFRKNMGIGTPEEIKAAGAHAYRFLFESGDFGSAAAMAEDVYGRESEEWKRASEASDAEWKKAEKRLKKRESEEKDKLRVTLSKDSTFADLFSAIEEFESKEGLGALNFEDELHDHFDAATMEEILAFQDAQAGKAASVKVLDFLKERGYSQKDVSAFLPIKFKRERKKKG